MRADEVEIAHPCPIDLRERIAGADAEFHCDHCDRPVHVLSHMSEAAAAEVLARRQRDNLCVAFLRAPDGRVHQRREGEALVPASRLAGPRMMLRASALALTVAACSSDSAEPPGSSAATSNTTSNTTSKAEPEYFQDIGGAVPATTKQVEDEVEHFEVFGGAPPDRDWDPDTALADGVQRVSCDALERRNYSEPSRKRLMATQAGRLGGRHQLEFRYCVDTGGRVVEVEHVSGDRELARLYTREMARWRFTPQKLDGVAVKVCTTQRINLNLDPDAPA